MRKTHTYLICETCGSRIKRKTQSPELVDQPKDNLDHSSAICSVCGETFYNEGGSTRIQQHLKTGKWVCVNCAIDENYKQEPTVIADSLMHAVKKAAKQAKALSRPCTECKGYGQIRHEDLIGEGQRTVYIKCTVCNGTGQHTPTDLQSEQPKKPATKVISVSREAAEKAFKEHQKRLFKEDIAPTKPTCPECGHLVSQHSIIGCIVPIDGKIGHDCPCMRTPADLQPAEPFKRYMKYEVMKLDDIKKYLTPNQKTNLEDIIRTLQEGRSKDGKVPCNSYVVVKAGLPYTEQVWKLIEDYETKPEHPKKPVCPECGQSTMDGICFVCISKTQEWAHKHLPVDLQPESSPFVHESLMRQATEMEAKRHEAEMPLREQFELVLMNGDIEASDWGTKAVDSLISIVQAHDSAVASKLQRLEIFHTDVLAGCDIDKGKQGLYRQKRVIIGPGKTQDELDLETAKEELKGTASKARAKFAEECRKKILEMETYGGNNPISIAYNRAVGRCGNIVRDMAGESEDG